MQALVRCGNYTNNTPALEKNIVSTFFLILAGRFQTQDKFINVIVEGYSLLMWTIREPTNRQRSVQERIARERNIWAGIARGEISGWGFFGSEMPRETYLVGNCPCGGDVRWGTLRGEFSRGNLRRTALVTFCYTFFLLHPATLYRWVSYNKTICSTGYFVIETLCCRNSWRKNKFYFIMFSLLCGDLIL